MTELHCRLITKTEEETGLPARKVLTLFYYVTETLLTTLQICVCSYQLMNGWWNLHLSCLNEYFCEKWKSIVLVSISSSLKRCFPSFSNPGTPKLKYTRTTHHHYNVYVFMGKCSLSLPLAQAQKYKLLKFLHSFLGQGLKTTIKTVTYRRNIYIYKMFI